MHSHRGAVADFLILDADIPFLAYVLISDFCTFPRACSDWSRSWVRSMMGSGRPSYTSLPVSEPVSDDKFVDALVVESDILRTVLFIVLDDRS